MYRTVYFLGCLAVLASVAACELGEPPPAGDVCAEAKNRFASCGASLPLLSDGPCTGTTRIVARCVAAHAHDCDELATLFTRIDSCVADMLDGGDSLLPPATDLPVPGRDGGKHDDAGHDSGASPPRDAGLDVLTAGSDSGVDAAPGAP